MKRIICLVLIVLFSAVAVAKDKDFKTVDDIVIPDDLRIVTLIVQFTDEGEVHRVEVVNNVLFEKETIASESGNITNIGFEIPTEILPHILTLRQMAETELKVYKGIK